MLGSFIFATHCLAWSTTFVMADSTTPSELHHFVSSLVLVADETTGKHQTGVLVLRHDRRTIPQVLLVAPNMSDISSTKLTSSVDRNSWILIDSIVTTRHIRHQYDQCTLEPDILLPSMAPLDNYSKMNFLEEHDHGFMGRSRFLQQSEDAAGIIHRKRVIILGFHDSAGPVDPKRAVSGEVQGIVSIKEEDITFIEIVTDRELSPTEIGSLVVHQFAFTPQKRWLAVGIITRRLRGERRYAMSLLDAFNFV